MIIKTGAQLSNEHPAKLKYDDDGMEQTISREMLGLLLLSFAMWFYI